ncbi:MAG: dihydroorotase [Deltaproteobacteria bacterium]|nr:dihydroorotase [Candidatus Anaeroferrophillus wilburensis]MBN2889890.1 dihydroorotase [Deltaproteobacteria bacterium]
MNRLLLKGGRVIDPLNSRDEKLDLLIAAGTIVDVGNNLQLAPEAGHTIELDNRWVMPGAIDMHTHLREPGQEYKETIVSGAQAAAAGGFTGIACMANTRPVNDCAAVTRFICEQAREAVVNVYPIGSVTVGMQGRQMVEMAEMAAAGVVAFSEDGKTVENSRLYRHAMEYAGSLGKIIICHCQDSFLFGSGVVHEGEISALYGLPAIPSLAEEIDTARCIMLAEYLQLPVHIAHVSTRGSVRLIAEAKERGVKVTAEVTPHHFTLDHRAVVDLYYRQDVVYGQRRQSARFNPLTKMSPPLREPDDVTAMGQALATGVIDVIASDHAPHEATEKDVEYQLAPFGVIGLETTLPLTLRLVENGLFSPSVMVERLSVAPARILGLEQKGGLGIGMDADITVIDPTISWTIDAEHFASKSRNTPFNGWQVRGKAVLTIVGGTVVYQDDQFR